MPIQEYLRKYAEPLPIISEPPHQALEMVVVIPAYDEPDLVENIMSLKEVCPPTFPAEVIVVLNAPADAPSRTRELHETQARQLEELNRTPHTLPLHAIVRNDLPPEKAGVGTARKIGMDEAARRLIEPSGEEGVITCLDADCNVAVNYWPAIRRFFSEHKNVEAASIAFEHDIDSIRSAAVCKAIVRYELHLRYYIEAQRFAGFPFAFHTVGSAMAVRAGTYARVGGMNRRKAGEDFYFLHKCIERGNFGEINETTVYPSARISRRVPFGTGRAMADQLDLGKQWLTYAPESFLDLKRFFAMVPEYYGRHTMAEATGRIDAPFLEEFLHGENFLSKLAEIRENTASYQNYRKRFFHWFNAFRLMKCLHFMRERGRKDVEVLRAAGFLLAMKGQEIPTPITEVAMLRHFRSLQRKGYQL